MDCLQVRRVLLLYIYEEKLSEEDIALLESHLCSCPLCNRELANLRRTLKLINGVSFNYPTSEASKARILNRIEANGWFEEGI